MEDQIILTPQMAEELFGGVLVDTEKLRQVVFNPQYAAEETSRLIWDCLSQRAVREGGTDSLLTGMALAELYKAADPKHRPGIAQVMEAVRDMNKVPVVSIKGKPVDGARISFGPSLFGPGKLPLPELNDSVDVDA